MRAEARVVATAGPGGSTTLSTLRSQVPLVLRATGGSEVHLVGGAAGPLGGDRLRLEIVVEPRATLTVRTAAAAIVLPGLEGATSIYEVDARVGDGASLHWLPEPTVAAAGCRHVATATIALAPTASLVWRDELVLGRHRETAGSLTVRTSVEVAGAPLHRQELAVDPASPSWHSPAVLDRARAVGSTLVVDARRTTPWPSVVLGPGAAVLPLDRSAALVSVVAPDAVELRRLLDAGKAVRRDRLPTSAT